MVEHERLLLTIGSAPDSMSISKSSADELLVPIVEVELVVATVEDDRFDETEDAEDVQDDEDDEEFRREQLVDAQLDPTQPAGVNNSVVDVDRLDEGVGIGIGIGIGVGVEEQQGCEDKDEVEGVEFDVVTLTIALPNRPAEVKCAVVLPVLR